MPNDVADESPRVPIVCPECDTASRVPLPDVAETLARHNERLHDGDEVAQVDPDLANHIADLVADDLGLLADTDEGS